MPLPSNTTHLSSSHPASRQRPKSPNRVLAEAEAQWMFSEAELANTPSVQDGMTQAEEKEIRAKGVNFIIQVGIMLKLPQLTLSTAAVFFQRFLMRASLKKERNGIPKLHHYQSAATALFLATKVEESCRKMKELILAFCRVAQKKPNLTIDEQSKDWWRWRDCILYNEDVLLETLCFDLTVESPHRQLFDMLKWYQIEHNKKLRTAAWSFVTDSNNTQLCLLFNSRTIAAAALYTGCRFCDIALPDDVKGRPWWETQHVRLKELRRATAYMGANYEQASNKTNGVSSGPGAGSEGERSIYVGLINNLDGLSDDWDSTRLRDVPQDAASPPVPMGSERRLSNASSVGMKREREEEAPAVNGKAALVNGGKTNDHDMKRPRFDGGSETNGDIARTMRDDDVPHDVKHEEEALRVQNGNVKSEADVKSEQPPEAVDVAERVKPETETKEEDSKDDVKAALTGIHDTAKEEVKPQVPQQIKPDKDLKDEAESAKSKEQEQERKPEGEVEAEASEEGEVEE